MTHSRILRSNHYHPNWNIPKIDCMSQSIKSKQTYIICIVIQIIIVLQINRNNLLNTGITLAITSSSWRAFDSQSALETFLLKIFLHVSQILNNYFHQDIQYIFSLWSFNHEQSSESPRCVAFSSQLRAGRRQRRMQFPVAAVRPIPHSRFGENGFIAERQMHHMRIATAPMLHSLRKPIWLQFACVWMHDRICGHWNLLHSHDQIQSSLWDRGTTDTQTTVCIVCPAG